GLGDQGIAARRHLLRLGRGSGRDRGPDEGGRRVDRAGAEGDRAVRRGANETGRGIFMASEKEKKPRPKSRPRRRLTDEAHRLWRRGTKDAKPTSRRPAEVPEAPRDEERPSLPLKPQSLAPMRTPAPQPPASPAPPRRPSEPPPLTGLDRRTSQRLARGQMEIEATLDLHGHSQEAAHQALLGFVSRSRSRGL